MRKRSRPQNLNSPVIGADSGTIQWFYVILTIVCAVFLAAGFFYAARQHFSAMDLGMKNSDLRKQIDGLNDEQRRLILSREVVRSPMEMRRIAQKKGLIERESPFQTVAAAGPAPAAKKLIERTVISSSSRPVSETSAPRSAKAFFPEGVAIAKPVKASSVSVSKEFAR